MSLLRKDHEGKGHRKGDQIIRQSTSAGTFYPGEKDKLLELLGAAYAGAGAKDPEVVRSKDVSCGISPHAGIVFSGGPAARLYSEISKAMPSRFIVIGPNHQGVGGPVSVMEEGEWATPLGTVQVDSGLASSLIDNSDLIVDDPVAHRYETNSVEVQLPFIQYLTDDFTFVPMLLNPQDLDSAIDVTQAILASAGDDVCVIASTDLVHFGAGYGYTPVRGGEKEVLEWIEKHDRQVLTMLVEQDVEGLYDFLSSFNYTMCGYGAAVIASLFASHNKLSGTVLDYTNSYALSKDTYRIVGYGSLIYRK